jgi:hypothetical protein
VSYRVQIEKKKDMIDRYRWHLYKVDGARQVEVDRGYGFTPFWCRFFAKRAITKHKNRGLPNKRNRTYDLDEPKSREPLWKRVLRG